MNGLVSGSHKVKLFVMKENAGCKSYGTLPLTLLS
jgi:hypothetical protein